MILYERTAERLFTVHMCFSPDGCSFRLTPTPLQRRGEEKNSESRNAHFIPIFVRMRKNPLFLIISIFICPALSQAQNFKAGAFAGISTSQVSGDNLAGFNKVGLYAGGFVNTAMGEKWKVQMEISYIGKGSRPTDIDREANPYQIYPTLNYAEVPILFIYKAKLKINIEAGPAFGVLVYSREDDSFAEREIERPYNRTEFTFIAGIDYFLSEKLSINSRWDNSFLPIRKHESGQTYGLNRGQYNTEIIFSLRYHF